MRSDRQPELPLPDERMAELHRTAAAHALLNPFESLADRERRSAHHHAEAARLSRQPNEE
jgi:hypothetical protein